jgi:hypothetical protein
LSQTPSTDKRVPLPGPFTQIGYVVRDLDETVASWLRLGIGPWFVLRDLRQDSFYRGVPCSVPFSVAFSNNGELQIEVICQTDDTPSVFTEFLQSGRESVQQLAWSVSDFDATVAAAEAAGWPEVWSGGGGDIPHYAYFEPSGAPAPVIEITELTEGTAAMAKVIRDAAANWDGTDPIRTLG